MEWIITTIVALITAAIFQCVSTIGMTDDIETWSGYVTQAIQTSRWKEYYQEAIYRTEYYYTTETQYTTDSKGRTHSHSVRVQHSRRVFDHWEDRTCWHEAYWTCYTTIGTYTINEDKFNYLCNKFNNRHAEAGIRSTGEHNSRMIDGDPNDYVTDNKTGWIEPVTTTRHFKNKIKAAPSLFSYSKVPTNISVYPWPESTDLFVSDRVMGTARASISTLKWDQMNASIGARKKVNLIIVGYGDRGMDIAEYQESKWIGGKKNDLVIVFGGNPNEKPNWVKVFGWTEKDIVKENIQSMLLDSKINDDIITNIQAEVVKNYVIKDWTKFDYIKIEPPASAYWIYFGVMILTQVGFGVWYNINDIDQSTDGSSYWSWPQKISNMINNLKKRYIKWKNKR